MEKVFDCHIHVLNGGYDDVPEMQRSQTEDYDRSGSNFLSVEGMNDAAQNAMGILFKLLSPENYAFGGLHYRFEYDFGEEIQKLYDIGFDGIKMIENKPTERKQVGYAQDDPRYDPMYRKAAELDMPFLIHVNDPAECWDINRCAQWMIDAGFFYGDGSYPSYEQLQQESIHMLEKFPTLRVCFAHLFFMSDDEPGLRALMNRFPQMSLDITSGTEMYYAFTEEHEVWKQFFLDFSDRILFGTDNCYPAGDYDRGIARTINDLQTDFLEKDGEFPLWDRSIRGIGLDEATRGKICGGNFRSFTSEKPKPINREKALAYLNERLADPRFRLTEAERDTITRVAEYLKNN